MDSNLEEKEYKANAGYSAPFIYQEIQDLRGDVGELKEIINNGICERTSRNGKAIERLSKEMKELVEALIERESIRKGQWGVIKKIIAGIGLFGSGIVTTLAILEYLINWRWYLANNAIKRHHW